MKTTIPSQQSREMNPKSDIGFTLTLKIAEMNGWSVVQPAVPGTDRDLGRFFAGVPETVPVR